MTPISVSPASVLRVQSWITLAVLSSPLMPAVSLSEAAQAQCANAQKIHANDPVGEALFGAAIAACQDVIAVGAPAAPQADGTRAGAVYLFRWNGTGWIQESRLTPQDLGPGDAFGAAVAVQNCVVLVGSPRHGASGAVYVFERINGTWAQTAELVPPPEVDPYALFGKSVSLNHNVAVVGAPIADNRFGFDAGLAFVYRRIAGQWVHEATLEPSAGCSSDAFGWSVSVFENTVAVATPTLFGIAPPDPNSDTSCDPDYYRMGRVHMFRYDSTTESWHEEAILVPQAHENTAGFGHSVSLDRNRLLVGWPSSTPPGPGSGSTGTAHIFEYAGGTWSQRNILAPGLNAVEGAAFGWAVALTGEIAVIGARYDDVSFRDEAGSAFVFVDYGFECGWELQEELVAADPVTAGFFGHSVAAIGDPRGNLVVVGATGAEVSGSSGVGPAGAVYTFSCVGRLTGDINGDGLVDIADLSILLSCLGTTCADTEQCCRADLNCDGSVDAADLSILLQNIA